MLHAFAYHSEPLLEKTVHNFCQALKDFKVGPHEFYFYRNLKGGFFAHEDLIVRLDGVLSMGQEMVGEIAILKVSDPLKINLKEALKAFLERLSLEKVEQSFDCKKKSPITFRSQKKRSFESTII